MIKDSLAIIVSDYYKKISNGLFLGAIKYCEENNIGYEKFIVPGALEVSSAIKIISNKKNNTLFDGYVALGCVIRGETSHFEIVINESSRGLTDLSLNYSLIIGNGILTVENSSQAEARADVDGQNKGGGAAAAALHLVKLKQRWGKPTGKIGFLSKVENKLV